MSHVVVDKLHVIIVNATRLVCQRVTADHFVFKLDVSQPQRAGPQNLVLVQPGHGNIQCLDGIGFSMIKVNHLTGMAFKAVNIFPWYVGCRFSGTDISSSKKIYNRWTNIFLI